MGNEGRQTTKGSLTVDEWLDSQNWEATFWQSQKVIGNPEQFQRNTYYRGLLEDGCSIARDFFAQDFSNMTIVDIGSGPMGILHVLKAKKKIAVDPLMQHYRDTLRYDVESDDVICVCEMAEGFEEEADVILCLNALDHMQWPEMAIANIYRNLVIGGKFLLITDLRTPEQLDVYHKLPFSQANVAKMLKDFDVEKIHNYPHQAGNPIRQLIVQCKKS